MSSELVPSPDDLFRAARYTECLSATEGDDSHEAHLLRARVYLQMDRAEDALTELSGISALEGDLAATAGALRCRALNMLRSWDATDAWLSTAASSCGALSAVGRSEIAIARGFVAMHRGRTDAIYEAAEMIEVDAGPWYASWKLHLIAWAAASHDDYVEHGRRLEQLARFMLENPAALDVMLLARCAGGLAFVAREMFSIPRFEFAVRLEEQIPWTRETREFRFQVKRALAWAHALHGSARTAHRLIFELIDQVPSPGWRPLLYSDQAHFVRATGCDEILEPLLERAIEYSKEISWDSEGEERAGLLSLIVVATGSNVAAARSLMTIYDSITTKLSQKLAIAHNRHLRAAEDHARGTVLVGEGNEREGGHLLKEAYDANVRFGFSWRPAFIALQLHMLTRDDAWLRIAEEAIAEFPESAIGREIRRRARGSADPRLASLSPAQRRVFELICHGKSNKEIASALKISVNTARNHVAAVLTRFGVQSRAQLAAVARESGLLT